MIAVRRAAERGTANLGWLDSRHTFSFGYDITILTTMAGDAAGRQRGPGRARRRFPKITAIAMHGDHLRQYAGRYASSTSDSIGTGSVIRPR